MPRDENDVSDSELDEEKMKTKEDPRNPAVYELYRLAANFSNQALDYVISLAVPGANVTDICAAGDAKMEELCKTVYSKATMTRGVAFPTCVSVNHIVGSFSPLRSADPQLLAVGDVVKFDMGAHLDGYASTVAHTIIVGATPEAPVTDRRADVVTAAEVATQAVLRLLKPGTSTRQLTAAVQKVAAQFDCHAIQGVYSHEVNRFVLEGEACFPGCEADAGSALAAEEAKREDFEVAVNQVWAVDVVLSTGTGKSHSVDARTTIYRRAQDRNYSVKLKSSKNVLADINRRFPDFPFSLRSFANEGATRLGITELTNHQLVDAYPVMSEKPGQFVAHLKFTALMMPNGFVKVTGRSIDTASIKSTKSVTDPELLALLSQAMPSAKSLKSGGKKKKKAAKAADAAAAAGGDDDDEAPALAQ